LVCIIKIVTSIEVSSSLNEISCEKADDFVWDHAGAQHTCYLNLKTVIKSPDATIKYRDVTVQGIYFHKNKNVEFLPMNISEKFPNLVVYAASMCSVKALKTENFRKLFKLRHLWLEYNHIEEIASDSFMDLKSLERIELRECKSF
jgi:Leucine rich repeat